MSLVFRVFCVFRGCLKDEAKSWGLLFHVADTKQRSFDRLLLQRRGLGKAQASFYPGSGKLGSIGNRSRDGLRPFSP